MTEYPADWTPEKIEAYRLLMEAKRAQQKTVEIKEASEWAARQHEKAKAEKAAYRLISDPWEGRLMLIEQERVAEPTGFIVKAPNNDGKLEWRVMSRFIMTSVLNIAPERQHAGISRRLAPVMQKLGWTGPLNLRFGPHQARGYRKAIED